MNHETILVVDDEAAVRFTLKTILRAEGWRTLEASDGEEALAILRAPPEPISLMICDLKMPKLDGMGLLQQLKTCPDPPGTIMITAHGDERIAVEAMKLGAIDYFKKPFESAEIVRVIHRDMRLTLLARENRRLRAGLVLGRLMVFASPAMFKVAEVVERIAARDITVLIEGESGTGKELVAKAIVRASSRQHRPFVRFNCGALHHELAEAELFGHAKGAFTGAHSARKGLFRDADGGTLLLDEIHTLSPSAQILLLRTIQEREVRPVGQTQTIPVDVRLLAATNRDLAREPGFREDMYYRLNVIRLQIPPLRERREDIPLLARHFADRYGEQYGLGPVHIEDRVLTQLQEAPWPGNVRQLEHTIQRMVALSENFVLDGDPFAPQHKDHPEEPASLKARMDAYEHKLILGCLDRCDGNRSETARQLRLSRPTLLSKMKKHGIQ